jgi:hypothetical protein
MAVAKAAPTRRMPLRRTSTTSRSAAVAEDRKEPPFEGGAQPVVHQKDPVPGPGRSAGQMVTIVLSLVVAAAILAYLFAR